MSFIARFLRLTITGGRSTPQRRNVFSPRAAGAAAFITLLLLCAPAVASATDYCVQPASSCSPANTYPASGTGVQAALDAAAGAGAGNRVLLGAGTYTAPTTVGFKYDHPTTAVQVMGQGSGQTILTGPADTDQILYFAGGPASTITDVGLRIPLRVANPSFLNGLSLLGSTAQRVGVTSDPALNGGIGVYDLGGTFEDGSITLPMSGPVYAFNTGAPGGSLRNTTAIAASSAFATHTLRPRIR